MKSEENIIDASIKIKEHFGFSPKNTEKIVLKFKNDLISAEKMIQKLNKEKNQFQEETYKIKKDLNNAQQQIQNLNIEKNQLQKEVNKIKNDLNNAKQMIQNLNNEKNQFQEETYKIKKDLNIAKQQIQNLNKEKNQHLDEANKTKNDLNNEKQMVQNLNKEKNKLQKDANEYKKDLNIAKQKIQNLSEEKNQLQNELNKIKIDKKGIDENLQDIKSLLNSFKQCAIQAKIPDDILKKIWDNKFGSYEKNEWDQNISQGREWDNSIFTISRKYEYKLSNANEIYEVLNKLHYHKNVSKREAYTARLYQLEYANGVIYAESNNGYLETLDIRKGDNIAYAKYIILYKLINDLGNLSIF